MNSLLKCHPLIPVDFVRGEGCFLYDASGRSYVDLESGSWAAILGHSHPAVTAALLDQAGKLMHLGVRTPNHLAGDAAGMLLELTGLTGGKCTFLSSGSEAVEFAVQAVRRVMPHRLLLSFGNAYHAAVGSASRKDPSEWWLVDWRRALEEDPSRLLESIPFERIGGFVFEPGGGGPYFARFPPVPLVQAMAARVRAMGGFVVVNEITTGFGRTGAWFGYRHYDLSPDVVAVGKGMGNGYPVSAVALGADFAGRVEDSGHYHAQSHQNNPLGCAVALAVMRFLREENRIELCAALGQRLLDLLRDLAGSKSCVLEVRGRGLLLALELAPGASQSGTSLQRQLLERGFIVGGYPPTHPAGTGLRLDPPLVTDEEAVQSFISALDELID